jgi:hypothetical protein
MKRLKTEFVAYRDMRECERLEKQRRDGKVTLASDAGPGAKPKIVKGAVRKHLVHDLVAEISRSRSSKFEKEGPLRHGVRQMFCLEGNPWELSDREARSLVEAALQQVGAVRPSWDEAQRAYADLGQYCAWCGGEMDTEGRRAGAKKFCTSECATAWRTAHTDRRNLEESTVARAAYAAVRREQAPPILCQHCALPFRPLTTGTAGRKFCSFTCMGIAHRGRDPIQCAYCSKEFYPRKPSTKCCSAACAALHKRTIHPVACTACGTTFRPDKAGRMFCSTACRDAAGRPAVHPRTCAWCSVRFLGKHTTTTYCCSTCVTMASQFRRGIHKPKVITPPIFDYVFRLAA